MINITFPDGSIREYNEGISSYEIAKSISEGLARNAVGSVINDQLAELDRPIYVDSKVKIVSFNDDEGKEIFWHSSAHLLAEALQQLYPGTKFGIGPAIENGFYYDVELPNDMKISAEDLPIIEKKMIELARLNSEYKMYDWDYELALSHYNEEGNEYKIELIEGLRNDKITYCKHGTFLDLCRGGHLPNTGLIKAVKLLSIAGAYWRGNSDNKMMTRIYGISFPKQKLLEEFIHLREEAEKRDHRKLGKELELYMITPAVGGGLPIWLPKGTIIRRLLEHFLKEELVKRGYQEVITPHIGNLNLYKTSGHYPYYLDSQYSPIKVEDEEYMLKPMNCPHHHQIYASKPRSYRDLPVRLAEFGTVYRYEQSGELSGLSRVRGFTQDDAHIYCMHEQLKDELVNCIDLTQLVFTTFGMEVTTRLSFRDETSDKYAGDPAQWDIAERQIKEVADEMGLNYFIGIGEASFYGPKIDFIVKDAIGRKWQLGTVQVDYVMPERFQLEYMGADNLKHRPVIIHRAPFGSMERFLSILIEHYAGNFPFWLAPVQATVIPIGENQNNFAQKLYNQLKAAGYRVELDDRSEKVNRKIAESEQQKVPFALVIGQKEVEADGVSLRKHGEGDLGFKPIDEILRMFEEINKPN